eukprot:3032521-Amphidinium_carterae.1
MCRQAPFTQAGSPVVKGLPRYDSMQSATPYLGDAWATRKTILGIQKITGSNMCVCLEVNTFTRSRI